MVQFPRGYYLGYRVSGAGSNDLNGVYLWDNSLPWTVNSHYYLAGGGYFITNAGVTYYLQNDPAHSINYYNTQNQIIHNWAILSGSLPVPTLSTDAWYADGADIGQVNGLYLPVAGGWENTGYPGYYIGNDAVPEPAFLQGSPDFHGTALYTGVQGINDYSSIFMTWTPVFSTVPPTVYPLVYIKPPTMGSYLPRYRYRRR